MRRGGGAEEGRREGDSSPLPRRAIRGVKGCGGEPLVSVVYR